MKIAIVTDEFPPAARGGSGIVAYREAKALMKRGQEVKVFTPGEAGHAVIDGVDVTFVGTKDLKRKTAWQIPDDRSLLEPLKIEIEKFKPDAIHCHHLTTHFGLQVGLWCAENYPTVMTVHDTCWVVPNKVWVNADGGYEPNMLQAFLKHGLAYNPFLKSRAKALFEKLKSVIFVSEGLKRYHESLFGQAQNFKVLHHALELDEWPIIPFADSSEVRIGFGGRLTKAKGWDVFVSLIEWMNRSGLSAVGSVIGKEESFRHLTSKIDGGFRQKFEFAGFIASDQDLRRWYGGLSCSFAGSLYLDPFVNITIESLACGRGVIVGPYVGSKEIMDEKIGHVLTPADLKDVSGLASRLATDRPFVDWSRNCSAARQVLDMNKHIIRLLAFYNQSNS